MVKQKRHDSGFLFFIFDYFLLYKKHAKNSLSHYIIYIYIYTVYWVLVWNRSVSTFRKTQKDKMRQRRQHAPLTHTHQDSYTDPLIPDSTLYINPLPKLTCFGYKFDLKPQEMICCHLALIVLQLWTLHTLIFLPEAVRNVQTQHISYMFNAYLHPDVQQCCFGGGVVFL